MSRGWPSRARRRARDAADVLSLLPVYLMFGVLKHAVPLPRLARWAWRGGAAAPDASAAARAVSAAVRIGRWLGVADRDCLQRSLLLYRELSRAGLQPRLVMAFRRDEAGVRGHAWVESGGPARPVPAEDVSSYVVALSFGAGGVLTRPEASGPGGTGSDAGGTSAPAARM